MNVWHAGEDVLFLDLSSDPYLFKGPRGDRQVSNRSIWLLKITIINLLIWKFSCYFSIFIFICSQKHIEKWRRWPETAGRGGTSVICIYLSINYHIWINHRGDFDLFRLGSSGFKCQLILEKLSIGSVANIWYFSIRFYYLKVSNLVWLTKCSNTLQNFSNSHVSLHFQGFGIQTWIPKAWDNILPPQ